MLCPWRFTSICLPTFVKLATTLNPLYTRSIKMAYWNAIWCLYLEYFFGHYFLCSTGHQIKYNMWDSYCYLPPPPMFNNLWHQVKGLLSPQNPKPLNLQETANNFIKPLFLSLLPWPCLLSLSGKHQKNDASQTTLFIRRGQKAHLTQDRAVRLLYPQCWMPSVSPPLCWYFHHSAVVFVVCGECED